ncbi:MAG: hypothetical protein J6U73_05745 [Alistipes sp.]|nr:hypothetical protein [Alistipes sp.]
MNRLLGTLFALATLVAIAFAILNYGNYTSMCFTPTEQPAPAEILDTVDTLDMEDTLNYTDTSIIDDATLADPDNIAPVDTQIDVLGE